jgi:hypothetical protein
VRYSAAFLVEVISESSTPMSALGLLAFEEGGTRILVQARGLTPGNEYVSLYYDNPTCELEPYSEEDVIGTYTANPGGNAHTSGVADDDLDEIHSVSVRTPETEGFELLACARVDN